MLKRRAFYIARAAILLTAVIILTASCDSGNSKKNVVVVNSSTVSANSELGKVLTSYLRNAISEMESQLMDLRQKAANDETALNNLRQAEIDFEMQAREVNDRVVSLFAENYVKALKEYREKNGVDLVLPTEMVNSYDSAVEVTEAVIAIMNSYGIPEGYASSDPDNAAETSDNATAATATTSDNAADNTPAAPDNATEPAGAQNTPGAGE